MLVNRSTDEVSLSFPADKPLVSPVSYDLRSFTFGDGPSWVETIAIATTATAIVPYVQAVAQELAKKSVDAAPGVYRRIHCRLRGGRKGVRAELKVSEGRNYTMVILAGKLPDEAHLSLMDLDFSDKRISRRFIYWDNETSKWRTCGRIKRRSIWRNTIWEDTKGDGEDLDHAP